MSSKWSLIGGHGVQWIYMYVLEIETEVKLNLLRATHVYNNLYMYCAFFTVNGHKFVYFQTTEDDIEGIIRDIFGEDTDDESFGDVEEEESTMWKSPE